MIYYLLTIDVFYRMQFNNAEQMNLPVGFLNPQRISQPNLVVKLRNDAPEMKGKSNREKARIVKEKTKDCKLQMATYIGRAMLGMQNKDYIMAPYNFK